MGRRWIRKRPPRWRKGAWGHRPRTIQRVAGLARGGATQGERLDPVLGHEGEHGAIAAPPGSAIAPAQPEQRPSRAQYRLRSTGIHRKAGFGAPRTQAPQATPDPGVVLRSHRIGHPLQGSRSGGHRAEEIEHLQPPEAPAASEGHQAPQGGVVPLAIGAGRIEPHEHQGRPLRLPSALQPPAITTAGAKDRCRSPRQWGHLWQAVATDGIQGAGDHGQRQ